MNLLRELSLSRRARRFAGLLMVFAMVLLVASVALSSNVLAQSPPATPSSVSVTRADGTLTASWDAISGATKHHVTYTDNGGASWQLAALAHPSSSIEIDADNSKTYIVGVRAGNDSDQWSGWRNSPSAGPYTPSPPGAVASVSLTRSDGKVSASWDAVSGATKYHVTYTTDGGYSWSAAASAHTTASIEIDADNSKTYIVGVRAGNSVGWGGWRNSAPASPYVTLAASKIASIKATIAIANHSGNWHYKANKAPDSACSGPVSATSHTVTGLSADTSYIYAAYSDANCATAIATADAFTTLGQVYVENAKSRSGACHVAANRACGFWFRAAGRGANLFSVLGSFDAKTGNPSGLSVTLRDRRDGVVLATLSGSGNPSGDTAYACSGDGCKVGWGSSYFVQFNASGGNYPNDYFSLQTSTGQTVSQNRGWSLTNGYDYHSGNGWATTNGSTPRVKLTADGAPYFYQDWDRITSTRAALTLEEYPNAWWYKRVQPGSGIHADDTCRSVAAGTEDVVDTGATAARWYTYTAYDASGCHDADALDSAHFRTPGRLVVSNITATSATLTLPNYAGDWWLRRYAPQGDDTCVAQGTTYTVNLTGLEPGTVYEYTGYSDDVCDPNGGSYIEAPAFTTLSRVSVSNVSSTGATLTLSGHTGAWHYKRIQPADSACNSAASATETLSDLTANTIYGYTAYTDSACSEANWQGSVYFSTTDAEVGNLAEPSGGIHLGHQGALGTLWANQTVAFTTGAKSGGYALTGATSRFEDKSANGSPGDIEVALYAASGDNLGAKIAAAAFSGSNPDTAGLYTYACSGAGCELQPNTKYFISISAPNATNNGGYTIHRTQSDVDHDRPSSDGWSIADEVSSGYSLIPIIHIAANELMPKVTATRDSAGDSATVSWTKYEGEGFQYYRVIVCDDSQYNGASCNGTVYTSAPIYDRNNTGPVSATGLDMSTGYGVILQTWRAGGALKAHTAIPSATNE